MIEKYSYPRIVCGALTIDYKPLLLTLHRNFTTAHSTSTHRTNFVVRVGSQNGIMGYGECGLPPKKPKCYLADIDDCLGFMTVLQQAVEE